MPHPIVAPAPPECMTIAETVIYAATYNSPPAKSIVAIFDHLDVSAVVTTSNPFVMAKPSCTML